MKTSKSFRLSEQAQENLRQLSNQTGSSDTAIVEMALAYFVKVMQNAKPAQPAEPEYHPDENLLSRRPGASQPEPHKRKRH